MKKLKGVGNLPLAVFGLIAIFAFTGLTNAQTSRRKVHPKPLATPVPQLTGAEIISQADDPSQPIAQPAERSSDSTSTSNSTRLKNLGDRVKKLESSRGSDYDDRQKRLLLNLDILTRAEQRSESLRKQLFEMVEKENSIKSRLDQIEIDIRPEAIERSLIIAGSLRPEDVRDARRRSLDAERRNLQSLLIDVQSTRINLSDNLQRSDAMVDKLRSKLEKEINDSLLKDDEDQ